MTDAGQDYFQVLGVPRSWHLNVELLAARHLALSRELHPDRFAQASPRERILSLERTTAVNDAYRTLRDPIRRAEYLLRQHGIGHSDQDLARGHQSAGTDPAFLAEIMEIREQMVEQGLAGGRGRETPAAQAIRAAAESRMAALDQEIDRQFTLWEADPAGPEARAALLAVDRCLGQRRYFVNIVHEIDGEEAVAGHGKLG